MLDNIDKMDVKQLRNAVQILNDEIAIMRRKYEDIIYNLDTDNFSSRFVKEQGNMKTAIEINAEGIKTKVSNEEFESTKTQTAEKIESEVKKLTDKDTELSSNITQTASDIRAEVKSATETLDGKFKNYSTTEQTASKISASLEASKEYARGYVTDTLAEGEYVTSATFKTQFDIYADGIYTEVSETYETKSDANSAYSSLQGSISSISQTAGRISSRVSDLETFKTSTFTQTAYGFTLDGESTTFTGVIYLTDNSNKKIFSLFHDETLAPQVILHSCSDEDIPLVLGDYDGNVYIGQPHDGREVATRNWVLENAGGSGGTATAVFG